MIRTLRAAFGAGYRAGFSGDTNYLGFPYRLRRQWLLAFLWSEGWERGIRKRLLMERKSYYAGR